MSEDRIRKVNANTVECLTLTIIDGHGERQADGKLSLTEEGEGSRSRQQLNPRNVGFSTLVGASDDLSTDDIVIQVYINQPGTIAQTVLGIEVPYEHGTGTNSKCQVMMWQGRHSKRVKELSRDIQTVFGGIVEMIMTQECSAISTNSFHHDSKTAADVRNIRKHQELWKLYVALWKPWDWRTRPLADVKQELLEFLLPLVASHVGPQMPLLECWPQRTRYRPTHTGATVVNHLVLRVVVNEWCEVRVLLTRPLQCACHIIVLDENRLPVFQVQGQSNDNYVLVRHLKDSNLQHASGELTYLQPSLAADSNVVQYNLTCSAKLRGAGDAKPPHSVAKLASGRQHLAMLQDCTFPLKIWSGAEIKGQGKREISEKTHQPLQSSCMIDTCENTVTRPGIEPGSPWWEVSILIAQPPRPQFDLRTNRKVRETWWPSTRPTPSYPESVIHFVDVVMPNPGEMGCYTVVLQPHPFADGERNILQYWRMNYLQNSSRRALPAVPVLVPYAHGVVAAAVHEARITLSFHAYILCTIAWCSSKHFPLQSLRPPLQTAKPAQPLLCIIGGAVVKQWFTFSSTWSQTASAYGVSPGPPHPTSSHF
ncbi:hypothetical protein PR048_012578 [Dryococelus australis]|uniref:Uncharacterized protein n=1 Tax=Dryococelus australis TaxID=614101 RepID=A0ABQ9HPR1_9NEOP|nr:hypothetical protein PR048_012578 [Dryococelus australis]